jgi:hypothetical protein
MDWGLCRFAEVCFFSLYVSVAVLILPHVCLWGKLHFAVALLFSVCFSVGYAFFSTSNTWRHVGGDWMCM